MRRAFTGLALAAASALPAAATAATTYTMTLTGSFATIFPPEPPFG